MFVLLELETDGEPVTDNRFCEFAAGNGGVIGGHGFQGIVLLIISQGFDPGEENGALTVQSVQLLFDPSVILMGGDDTLHLVGHA